MAKFSDYLGLDDCIGLMDWESSMDGTSPSTSPTLVESIHQMGDLLDPEQVDDNHLILTLKEIVIKLRMTMMYLIWTL